MKNSFCLILFYSLFLSKVIAQNSKIKIENGPKGCFEIIENNKKGVQNRKGTKLIPFEFDEIKGFDHKIIGAFNKEKGWKLYSENGLIIEAYYDTFQLKNDSLIIINQKGKFGLISIKGQKLLNTEYRSIEINHYGFCQALQFDKYIISDSVHKVTVYGNELSALNDSLYTFKINDFFYLINYKGINLYTTKDSNLFKLYTDKYTIKIKKIKKTDYFNTDNYYSPSVNKSIKQSFNGYKWGFIADGGDTILPYIYDKVSDFQYNTAFVKLGTQFGLINKYGKYITKPIYDSLEFITPYTLLYKYDCYYGVIDTNGLKKSADNITCLDKDKLANFYHAYNDSMAGMFNFRGETVLPFLYQNYTISRNENMTFVKVPYYKSIINNYGVQILDTSANFQEIKPFMNGFAKVKKFNKYGFIDSHGGLVIAYQYDSVGTVQENRASVNLKGKWGFVDQNEKFIAQPIYTKVWPYTDSVAIVQKGKKLAMLTYEGKELFPAKYEKIIPFTHGYYKVLRGTRFGLINKTGHECVFTKYDDIIGFNSKFILVKLYGKYGILNFKDTVIEPADYDIGLINPYGANFMIGMSGYRETLRF